MARPSFELDEARLQAKVPPYVKDGIDALCLQIAKTEANTCSTGRMIKILYDDFVKRHGKPNGNGTAPPPRKQPKIPVRIKAVS